MLCTTCLRSIIVILEVQFLVVCLKTLYSLTVVINLFLSFEFTVALKTFIVTLFVVRIILFMYHFYQLLIADYKTLTENNYCTELPKHYKVLPSQPTCTCALYRLHVYVHIGLGVLCMCLWSGNVLL